MKYYVTFDIAATYTIPVEAVTVEQAKMKAKASIQQRLDYAFLENVCDTGIIQVDNERGETVYEQ